MSTKSKKRVHLFVIRIIVPPTIADLSEVDFFYCYCNDFSGRKNRLVSQRAVFCLQPIVVQRTVTCVGCYVICASFEPHHATALIKNADDEALVYQMLPANTHYMHTRTHVNVMGG